MIGLRQRGKSFAQSLSGHIWYSRLISLMSKLKLILVHAKEERYLKFYINYVMSHTFFIGAKYFRWSTSTLCPKAHRTPWRACTLSEYWPRACHRCSPLVAWAQSYVSMPRTHGPWLFDNAWYVMRFQSTLLLQTELKNSYGYWCRTSFQPGTHCSFAYSKPVVSTINTCGFVSRKLEFSWFCAG